MLEHTVPYTSVYRIPYYHLLPHSYRKPHQPQVHVVPDTQAHVGNNPIHISQLDLPGCEQWPEPLSKSSPFVGWQENQIDGWMDGWMNANCILLYISFQQHFWVLRCHSAMLTASAWSYKLKHNVPMFDNYISIICSSSLLFIAVCCGLFSWSLWSSRKSSAAARICWQLWDLWAYTNHVWSALAYVATKWFLMISSWVLDSDFLTGKRVKYSTTQPRFSQVHISGNQCQCQIMPARICKDGWKKRCRPTRLGGFSNSGFAIMIDAQPLLGRNRNVIG